MFFCTVCCPKVPLALKLRQNSILSLERENICKEISDLSTKIEKLCSSQKNCKRTSKKLRLHCLQYNVVLYSSCSMAVDIVRESEDKECHKNNLMFYNVPERTTPSWKADSAYCTFVTFAGLLLT